MSLLRVNHPGKPTQFISLDEVKLTKTHTGGKPKLTDSQRVERFWSKVEKGEGCWTWSASRDDRGYGTFWNGERVVKTHRLGWELTKGPIPDGLWVLHHCDNPPCLKTEPDEQWPEGHLFLGTNSDNLLDAVAKGRHRFTRNPGEKHGMARLTIEDVIAIRSSRERVIVLAALYGVAPGHIYQIKRRERWGHLP